MEHIITLMQELKRSQEQQQEQMKRLEAIVKLQLGSSSSTLPDADSENVSDTIPPVSVDHQNLKENNLEQSSLLPVVAASSVANEVSTNLDIIEEALDLSNKVDLMKKNLEQSSISIGELATQMSRLDSVKVLDLSTKAKDNQNLVPLPTLEHQENKKVENSEISHLDSVKVFDLSTKEKEKDSQNLVPLPTLEHQENETVEDSEMSNLDSVEVRDFSTNPKDNQNLMLLPTMEHQEKEKVDNSEMQAMDVDGHEENAFESSPNEPPSDSNAQKERSNSISSDDDSLDGESFTLKSQSSTMGEIYLNKLKNDGYKRFPSPPPPRKSILESFPLPGIEISTIGILRFRCPEAKCSFRLASNEQLYEHLLIGHGISQPYRCFALSCDAKFATQNELEQHNAQHHLKGTLFVCSKCPVGFCSKWDLDVHLKGCRGVIKVKTETEVSPNQVQQLKPKKRPKPILPKRSVLPRKAKARK